MSDINFDEEVITNLVMRSISNYEIRDPIMTGMLRPYLGQHTAHFCHELYNYANSPYDMIGYDRNVRYSSRQDYSSFFQPATQVKLIKYCLILLTIFNIFICIYF